MAAFKRISVAATQVDVEEHVDETVIRLWLLPHHGFYPTREIALAVAAGHECDESKIRKVSFVQRDCAQVPKIQGDD